MCTCDVQCSEVKAYTSNLEKIVKHLPGKSTTENIRSPI